MATWLASSFGNGSGVDQAGVQGAVNAASAGDTVVLSSGSATWTASVNITTLPLTIKGAGTLQSLGNKGSTRSQLTLLSNNTSNGSGSEVPLFNVSMSADLPFEIYGIYMQSVTASTYRQNGINVFQATNGIIPTQVKIHDCTFDSLSFAISNTSGNGNSVMGVCYCCTFINNRITARDAGYTGSAQAGTSVPSPAWGTDFYMVYEDNNYLYGNFGSFPQSGGWGGGPQGSNYMGDTQWPMNYMVRYCAMTVNQSVADDCDGWDMHGNQDTFYNAMGFVIHDNVFTYSGPSGQIKIADCRGGVGSVIYNNVITGESAYISIRANANTGGDSVLPTQTYIYNNTQTGGAMAISTADGVTLGTNYFTTNPFSSGYTEMVYPHPLRQASNIPIAATIGFSPDTLLALIGTIPRNGTLQIATNTVMSLRSRTIHSAVISFNSASSLTLAASVVPPGLEILMQLVPQLSLQAVANLMPEILVNLTSRDMHQVQDNLQPEILLGLNAGFGLDDTINFSPATLLTLLSQAKHRTPLSFSPQTSLLLGAGIGGIPQINAQTALPVATILALLSTDLHSISTSIPIQTILGLFSQALHFPIGDVFCDIALGLKPSVTGPPPVASLSGVDDTLLTDPKGPLSYLLTNAGLDRIAAFFRRSL